MLQIKHRQTGEVIFETAATDLNGSGSNDRRFVGTDLRCADLRGHSLFHSDFTDANLEGADLTGANLSLACFRRANLRGAILLGADMYGTAFDDADLSMSVLVGIHFWLASFSRANFEGADIAETSFLECEGLGSATGLDRLTRFASAGIDRQTLLEGIVGLPDTFLFSAGYTQREIAELRGLVQKDSGLLSCFVSHAEDDLTFATRLTLDLRRKNVNCWHYKDRLRGGAGWRAQIARAIKEHDRLLLICSRRSIYRTNVVHEIILALDEQKKTGQQKLFPVMLDDHIISSEFLQEARELTVTRVWDYNWVPDVVNMHIPDFSSWESNPNSYRDTFLELLASLRVPNSV